MNRILFLGFLLIFANSYIFSQDSQLESNIRIVTNGKKATVGVAVIFDGKDTLTVNNKYRYPMMSVYKFHQALAVLDYLNKNNLPLDTKIPVSQSDLSADTYSPLRDEKPSGNYDMSVGDLLKYSVSYSDNNACDILFKYMGGTQVVEDYVKSLGVEDIAIVATEQKMHESPENQYLNWTTPLECARLLEKFTRQNILSEEHTAFLKNLMIETTTGKDKIKYLLPDNVKVGHKTGSSFRNEFGIQVAENDVAFITLPNGKQYSVAIFVMNSREDDKTNTSLISSISRVIYDYYKTK